jgi:hypothetical protein
MGCDIHLYIEYKSKNPEFDFEKDLPNIIAVQDRDSHISEIKIDFL